MNSDLSEIKKNEFLLHGQRPVHLLIVFDLVILMLQNNLLGESFGMTPIIIHFLFCFLGDLCQDRPKQLRGNLYGRGKMSWERG